MFNILDTRSVTAKRSFSDLKWILNNLRNSISHDRLSNITVLKIENRRTKQLYVDEKN